jgi:hypothetical protein
VGLLGRPGFGLGSPTFFYKRIEVFDDCSGGNSRLSHLSGVGGGNFLDQRVYDDAGNVIQTHEHKGDFKES